jgi:hypothetical protein
MIDFTKKAYAEWLETILPQLFAVDPESISIVGIMKDGAQCTAYFNADNRDRIQMIRAIVGDCLKDWLVINADMVRDIVLSEDEDNEND